MAFAPQSVTASNFPLLKAYFAEAFPDTWVEPPEPAEGIKAFLLGPWVPSEAAALFQERFGRAATR